MEAILNLLVFVMVVVAGVRLYLDLRAVSPVINCSAYRDSCVRVVTWREIPDKRPDGLRHPIVLERG
jgi:hypothetical protein